LIMMSTSGGEIDDHDISRLFELSRVYVDTSDGTKILFVSRARVNRKNHDEA